jgi:GxxExxY protein
MAEKLIHSTITEKIIQSFFIVTKTLPNGLSTDFYRNALAIEFEQNNLTVIKNHSIELKYRAVKIGELKADFLINEIVLVTVVNVESINKSIEESSKLLLRNSEYEICMVLNFSGESEYKRLIFSNDYKSKN